MVGNLKDLGDTSPIEFTKKNGKTLFKEFKLKDVPPTLVLPVFNARPEIVEGGTKGDFFAVAFKICHGEVSAAVERYGKKHKLSLTQRIRPMLVARFLAKVTHGFIVGEILRAKAEPGEFNALLPNFILGRDNSLARFLVGEFHGLPASEPGGVFELTRLVHVIGGNLLLSATIRLFYDVAPDVPPYHVIAGTLPATAKNKAAFAVT